MKSGSIVRKVDELGRIVLPIELRRVLDIAERDEMEIYLEDDKVILRKYEPTCVFCSIARGLVTYRGKTVCKDCIRSMNQI
jgi:transcriptional pleiotropic regulator of transition state genes